MKKFRLLLVMSSLLALVCSFTACNTDIADDYPAVEIALTAGQADGNSLTFTITATGADDIYYWVEAVDPEKEAEPELSIEDASYLDAQVDVNFEQEVTASKLKYTTEYKIYAYAKNFAHNAYAAEITMTTGEAAVVIPAPEVEVVADEEEVYEDAFLMWVTTKNATKAAWLVVPKYTEGVDAAKVFADGTLIEDKLNEGEIAVAVEDLTPDTEYDFYAAVENSEGVQVLSSVVAVTTAKKTIPVVMMQFTELLQTVDLATAGLPGMFFMLNNPETGDFASVFMYDISQISNYPGYMANGMYPALTGSFDSGSLPEASCVLADPAYTNFENAGGTYLPVGDMGADEDGNPYGINLMTAMPDADNNMLEFNFYAVNAATNEPVIIRGQYIGPLGYVTSIATWPFNLSQWGFTAFESTTEGNVVTLTSNSINGEFKLILTTENGNIEDNFTVGETLAGGFTSFVEGAPEFFELQSGRIAIAKAENGGANDYLLIISTRGDETIMVGGSGAYKVEALEYPITITFPAAEALSVDGKRWALPSSFSEVVAGVSTAVFFVDMGVSMPGKLLVALDAESAYGAEAAGIAMLQQGMMYDYTVEATDATSGKVVLKVTDHFGDVSDVELPYSNLAAESVTVDFTNMLGNMGITACECTLYTKEVTIQ